MADTALSALASASALDGTELYYTVQGGADKKATGDQLRTRFISYLTSNPQTFSTAQAFTGSTAAVVVGANGGSSTGIKLFGSSTGDITIRPNSVSSVGVIFQLPANFGGTASLLSQANSATGTLSWVAATGGGDMLAANNLSEVNSITAFNTIKQAATTASTGVVQLSTSTAAITGTDSVLAVTPFALAAMAVPLAGNKVLTGGFAALSSNYGTVTGSNQTISPVLGSGNIIHCSLNGSSVTSTLTFDIPNSVGTIVFEVLNAGTGVVGATLSTSNYTKVDGTWASTNGSAFLFMAARTNSKKYLNIVALQ